MAEISLPMPPYASDGGCHRAAIDIVNRAFLAMMARVFREGKER